MRDSSGFTLIELMVVVVIIGVLAAIALPNFVAMQDRARESEVKENMHAVQLAVEDFAVQNTGLYPLAADAAAVQANLQGGNWQRNPFSNANDPPVWNVDPATPGILGINPAAILNYTIKGYGRSALLPLTLSNG